MDKHQVSLMKAECFKLDGKKKTCVEDCGFKASVYLIRSRNEMSEYTDLHNVF